jgi:hypothetical protein
MPNERRERHPAQFDDTVQGNLFTRWRNTGALTRVRRWRAVGFGTEHIALQDRQGKGRASAVSERQFHSQFRRRSWAAVMSAMLPAVRVKRNNRP